MVGDEGMEATSKHDDQPRVLSDAELPPVVEQSAPASEHPPYLYDEDGTVIAARGTFESVSVQCRVLRNNSDAAAWVDVLVADLPHPDELLNTYGEVERRAGERPVAWSDQTDRADVARMARVKPCPGDTCDTCEQVLTAADIAESGDFDDCERLPRESWFEGMNPCPYNKWGPNPDGVPYVMFPDS